MNPSPARAALGVARVEAGRTDYDPHLSHGEGGLGDLKQTLAHPLKSY